MEQFIKSYGFLILMMLICFGSHFFMHRTHHNGKHEHDEACKKH